MSKSGLLSLLLLSGTLPLAPAWTASPPPSKRSPVMDTYHGVEVTDPYRWLEDWSDPVVQDWTREQTAFAREYLDHRPGVADLRQQVTAILSANTTSYGGVGWRSGVFFAVKNQPPKQQSFLVRLDSPWHTETERVLVDPNTLDPSGATTIDWYVPSFDGRLVAVSLSRAGTEAGDVHVFDTNSGRQVHEVIPRVNTGTAGGSLAWLPDGSGFFYTRHPRGQERAPEDLNFYQQVYFHALGTPTEDDRYELGRDFPRIAEIQLEMQPRTGWLLVTVQNGDGGEFAHYVRDNAGDWRQFSRFGDKTIQATFGRDNDLFLISRESAPRGRILRLTLDDLDPAHAKVLVPEQKGTVVTSFHQGAPSMVVTPQRLYVTYQLGGPSELKVFNHAGETQPAPDQPGIASVGGLMPIGEDRILFSLESYVAPRTYYSFDAVDAKARATELKTSSPVALADCRVVREFATSRDGTRVPVNILIPPNTNADSPHPCIAYGYGGYGISMVPGFNPLRRILMDHGVLFAVANLRGGGEFGETWHQQGNLTRKQNVFDDFAAVLDHLVERGYTRPEQLAIMGGSNGGLLMGATLTQHPHAMKAVVSSVGIYDMLRVELSPNGAFNVTEFGTVREPDQFRALYAYSPYHHVREGTAYPATLFLTGANDPRVDPMHSRKMTALLQHAKGGDAPILLLTSLDTGHGAGTPLDVRINQQVDILAFLFDQLGVR
ncbi:MAG: S9 family peptidase [Verrucomicrobiales bacterium]|nr:S9 family peptidase [Verrucomicrobiales bacterium]